MRYHILKDDRRWPNPQIYVIYKRGEVEYIRVLMATLVGVNTAHKYIRMTTDNIRAVEIRWANDHENS